MTVPNCATLRIVKPTFAEELRHRRTLLRLSQEKLAKRSGVSASQIGNIEARGSSAGRTTVIDLVAAFRGEWDINEALRLAGHEPITGDELAILDHIANARVRLDRAWDDLTAPQQHAVAALVEAIVDPRSYVRSEDPAARYREHKPDTDQTEDAIELQDRSDPALPTDGNEAD